MAMEKGSAFLLKINNNDTYIPVAGMRTTQLSIQCDQVVVSSKDSNGWRTLLSQAGMRQISISGADVFTGSTAETRIKSLALSGSTAQFEVSFEGGDKLRGPFLVTRLDYSGDYDGERSYALSLESAGAVEVL